MLTSKAKLMTKHYNNYTLLGPYFEHQAQLEFEPRKVPKAYKKAFKQAKKLGITLHYGKWLIQGEPNVILIDFNEYHPNLDEIKHELWEKFQVDSLHAGSDFDNPLRFSQACATLIKKLEQTNALNKNTVVHAHEWMSGFTVLQLKDTNLRTVFTTHATMLGRTYSAHYNDLYTVIHDIDPDKQARRLNIAEKHSTEKACAHHADIFTTVSKTTGNEAEVLLQKKPDVLVLNGVDSQNFPSIENTSVMHVKNKKVLKEFQAYHFFPYYTFDLDNNLMFMFAGRYEYKNKGLDIYTDALAKLNKHLKKHDKDKTVTAFFFLAVNNQGVKKQLLENKNSYRHIKHYVERESKKIQRGIINEFIEKGKDFNKHVFKKDFVQGLKKDVVKLKKDGNPPITTHHMYNEENDPLINHLRQQGLNNDKTDNVKVVVYPQYLDGNDGLLNLDYFETITATHLGIFPSYYEPWGYTPLETAALGVASITTDLAGFGRFIQDKVKASDNKQGGIFVVNREEQSYDEQVQNLYEELKKFTENDHGQRVQHKLRAKQLSHLADWQNLIYNYIKAHNLALEK